MPDMVEWRRIAKVLCPYCSPRHVLDNGRLWILCGLWRLLRDDDGPFSEAELIEVVKRLPKRRKRRRTTHA